MSNVEWRPISRLRTHERVLVEIENRLRAGELRSGDRLPPERHLAERLGVSRGAVREALRILEAIGVVEAGQGSGPTSGSVIVADSAGGLSMVLNMHLQADSLRPADLVEVRVALERLAVGKISMHPDDPGITRLADLVDQMRATTSTSAYNDLDTAFHVQVGAMSGNELVSVLMTALRAALRHTMVSAFERLEDPALTMKTLTAEHAAIVDALAAGDSDLVVRLVNDHITSFYDLVGLTSSP